MLSNQRCPSAARVRAGRGVGPSGRSVEPVDEHVHLALDLRGGGRRLEMHRRPVDATGDDLHRVGMPPIGADGSEPAVMCQEHPMPAAECVVGQRGGVGRVDVDHHLCDALFARP